MVLVIRPPSETASKSQGTDQRQSEMEPTSTSGLPTWNACTMEAMTPAEAGVGIPTKYLEPPGAMPCTLKRGRRHAQQIKKARQQSHPKCPSCRRAPGSRLATLRTPHE